MSIEEQDSVPAAACLLSLVVGGPPMAIFALGQAIEPGSESS